MNRRRLLAVLLLLAFAGPAPGQEREITFDDLSAEIDATKARIEEARAAGDEEAVRRREAQLALLMEGKALVDKQAELETRHRELPVLRRKVERDHQVADHVRLDWIAPPETVTEPELEKVRREAESRQRALEQIDAAQKAADADLAGLAAIETATKARLADIADEQARVSASLAEAADDQRPILARQLAMLRFEHVYLERRLVYLEGYRGYLKERQAVRQVEREIAHVHAAESARRLELFARRFGELVSEEVRNAEAKLEQAIEEEARARTEGASEFEVLLRDRGRRLAEDELEIQKARHLKNRLESERRTMEGRRVELDAAYEETRHAFERIDSMDEGESVILRRTYGEIRDLARQYEDRIAPRIDEISSRIEEVSRTLADAERAAKRLESDFQTDQEAARALLDRHIARQPDTLLTIERWRELRRNRIDTLRRLVTAREEVMAELQRLAEATTAYGDAIEGYLSFFEEKRFWLRERSSIEWASFQGLWSELAGLPSAAGLLARDVPARLEWANRNFRDRWGWPSGLALGLYFATLLAWFPFLRFRVARIHESRAEKKRPTPVDHLIRVVLDQVKSGFSLGAAVALALVFHLFYGIRGPIALTILVALSTAYLYVQVRRLLATLFEAGESGKRLLSWVDDKVARHVHRTLRAVLVLSVAFLPIGVLLARLGYDNAGFLEAWWLAYQTGLALALLWLLSNRRTLHLLVPPGETAGLRTLRISLSLANPFVMFLVCFIYGLHVSGYRHAADYLARASALSVAVVVGMVVVYRVALDVVQHRMREVFKARYLETPEEMKEEENQRQLFLLRVSQLALSWAAIGIVLVSILWLFGYSVPRAKELAEAPVSIFGREISAWNVIAAFLSIYVALRLAEILRGIERHFIFPRAHISRGAEYTVQAATKYAILGVGLVLAMTAIHLDLSDFQWFMAAAGIGIGFGLQEIISNFVCGIVLLLERPIQVGDVVMVEGNYGQVYEITIRSTTIRTFDNNSLIYPNKHFITGPILNLTHLDPRIRRDIVVGVAYGSDVKLVKKILLEVLTRDRRIQSDPAPEVFFDAFGDSALVFRLRFWPDPTSTTPWPQLASDLHSGIEAILRRNDVEVPFPQRDLHVRTLPPGLLPQPAPLPAEPESPAPTPEES